MKKYTVETIGKKLITVTHKDLARIYFEQNCKKYNYITLNEVVENDGNTFVKSLKIFRK